MNTNDQWFNPGDKVMRVSRIVVSDSVGVAPDDPKEGVIYCVEALNQSRDGHNCITLIGMRHHPRSVGYLARNFRRVDEIKLCVVAAKHIKQREEELV